MEDLLDDVEKAFKNNLNDKIAAIEAEKLGKSKGLTGGLASVAASAYYRQTWSEKILNDKVAFYYGVENIAPIDGGGDNARIVRVFCEIVLVDGGDQYNDTHSRAFRYGRAVEEVAKEKLNNLGFASQIKIEAFAPVTVLDAGTSEEMKIAGIKLTTSIA